MTTIMNQRKWALPLFSMAIAAMAVIAIWQNTHSNDLNNVVKVRSGSFINVFSELGPLTDAADTIVVGTVKGVAGSGIDRGRDGDGSPTAYTVYEFEVTEVLKGDTDDVIHVIRTDPSEFPDDPLTVLGVGEDLVLYLEELPAAIVPTITYTNTIYVPISLDNGVFDIDLGPVGSVDDTVIARPRGISPDMFAEGTEFTAADIRRAIEPEPGSTGPVGNTQ